MKGNLRYLLILFLAIILLPINVHASEIILTADKTDLKPGDELVISANLPSDMESYALLATLKYDEKVFERIDDKSFSGDEGLVDITYNNRNNRFGIINKSGKADDNLFVVHLVVKEDANVGNTNIALTNVSSSDGETKENLSSSSVKVYVTRDAKEGEEIPTYDENEIVEDEEKEITSFSTKPIIIGLIISAILLLILTILVKVKYKDHKKTFITLLALLIASLVILITLLCVNGKKKDVNKDGVKDYNDGKSIVEYLLDIDREKTSDAFDQDVNNDGKVDITDVGYVTKKTTQKTKVTLKEDGSSAYALKGKLTLSFKANITPKGTKIKKVKIDGKYYDVKLVGDVYSVTLDDIEEAGNYKFTITSVMLDNKKEVNTKLTFEREILKDAPNVHLFDIDEENNLLTFKLLDEDKSFKSGKVNIYDADNKLVYDSELKSDNTIEYPFDEEKSYQIVVLATFDLDSNDNKDNYYEDEEIFNHSFKIYKDYNFKLANASITDIIQKDEKPIVTFTSTNNKGAKVEVATLNNQDYNISKIDGNTYEVELTHADTSFGKHTVTLDSVELSTLKLFQNEKDYSLNKLTYSVLKSNPEITNINLTSNRDNKTVTANFNLIDEDSALENLKAVLLDSTGKIIDTKEINIKDLKNNNVTLSYGKNLDGLYKVEFLADYTLGDKYKYTNTDIGNETIAVFDDIHIENITIKAPNTKYPVKGQKKYEVIIDVYVGNSVFEHFTDSKGFNSLTKYSRMGAVTINGLNYVVEGQSSSDPNIYKSRISLTIPSESGIVDLKINRVQMQYASYYIKHEDYYSVPLKEMQIEVLKDVPTIDNIKVVDDYENKKATLDFDVILDAKAKDNDDSFKSGTIELGNTKYDINRGHNTITFNDLVPDQTFDIIFKASYDLDTDTLEETTDQNEYQDKEIYRIKYGLYNPDIYDSIKVVKDSNKEYYKKNEKIELNFKVEDIPQELNVLPNKVIIDDKEYSLTKKDDNYIVALDGYINSGRKKLSLTDVILDNGKRVTLKDPTVFEIEVLKDPLSIIDYKYEVLENNNLKVSFKMQDLDRSLVGKAKIKITNEDGKVVYDEDYTDEVTLTPSKGETRYYVTITSSYDLDIDNTNSYNNYDNVKLFEDTISLDENNIELKDINEINLYHAITTSGKEETILVNETSKEELEKNISEYFVEINMDTLPSTHARIKNVLEEDNHLILVLDYQYVTKEKSNKEKTIRIDYGVIKNGVARNENHPDIAVKLLIERLKNNEDITLTQNYDFSYASSEGDTYVDTYTGHLDGQGYTLRNLSKPLFANIKGEVKNLNIFNVTFGSKGYGALANRSEGATITGVTIDKVNKTQTSGTSGGFVGTVINSTIKDSKATSVYLRIGYTDQNNGTFIGQADNSTIENCYAEGTIDGGWNFTSGFIGNAKSSTVKNNFVKVKGVNLTGGTHASFATAWQNTESIYENNICIASNFDKTMISSAKKITNNYFYYASNDQNTSDGINKITKDEINEELFTTKAHFSADTWRFKDVSYDNLPTLQIENTSVLSDTSNEDYVYENEILYKNLTKLMPFYDSDKIIESAKGITDNYLKTKEIVHILPVDKNGAIVNYLTTDNVKRISKIKVVYKTKETAEYNVIYDNTYDMVVSYRIPELKIDYNFNHYAIDTNSQVVNNLTNYLKKLTYTNNLDTLTPSDDSRIYRDYYNEVTSKNLKEFVLKYLSTSNYTNTNNNDGINNYLEREVKKDKKIEKVLYVYNYINRWYSLDIEGMNLSDFVLFNMQGFDESLTPQEITNIFFKNDSNFNTGSTNTAYASTLGSYTKLDTLAKFLEYVVTEFSNEKDMSEWVRKTFKGYLVEIPVMTDGKKNDKVLYTLWDHFSHEDASYHNPYKVYNFILPILTLPKNAAYIVSSPVQFVIGAQRTYIVDPEDPKDHATLVNKIKVRTDRMTNYYATAYGILNDEKLFNDIHTWHTDKRYTYDENGIQTYQQKGSTEEPFHKNFNEVVGQWAHSDGNNAVAWGDRIDWSVAGFLDGDLRDDGTPDPGHTPYNTWSHESAHNIDARLFLRNNGRRYDGHGEDYADSNLTQGFNRNDIVMNLSINFKSDQKVGSNLRPDRINTQAKVWSFYKGVFESVYVMDYLEALAFLELSPEDQATLAVQVSYPDEDKYVTGPVKEQYLGRRSSRYTELTAEDFEKMDLKTVDDLIKNRIMLQPGVYKLATRGVSLYGGEGLNVVHWYQPNNPYGRPDSYSLKWIAYEMLGYKGYDNGYIEYYSNIHPTTLEDIKNYKTDKMALSKITDGAYDDFDEYKKYRFSETKTNLGKLNSKVNVQKYVQKLYDELKKDAEYRRTKLDDIFTKRPKCLDDYWCVHGDLADAISLKYSSEVRYDIYYTLKTETNDFTTSIYSSTQEQDVNHIVIQK